MKGGRGRSGGRVSKRLNLFLPRAFHSASMPCVPLESEDRALPVAAARGGDPDAWDVLVRRYQLPLFAYVMDLVRHHATSLDLVQETLVRATRHLGGLREDARFGSWLFGIAHQQVVQHWRRCGRSPFSDEAVPDTAEDGGAPPDVELVRGEDAAELLGAVDVLSEAHRSVLLLHYLEGFSLQEITEITGLSPGTVKSRLHYARRSLRERLTARIEAGGP